VNKLIEIFEKLRKSMPSGKILVYIKGFLFINFAFFIGMWLGMKLFFPDDFILAKINSVLFVKDMGLTAEDVSVSPFGNISFYDGVLTKKGEDMISFRKLKFSPSIFEMMSGDISGEIYLEDVNNQGGELEVEFDSSKNPCYSFDLSEIPVAIFNALLTDMSFTGVISGEGQICMSENQKYSGEIDLSGDEIVLRGKIPTPMGAFDIGSVLLGKIEFYSKVTDNKVDIEKFLMSGVLNFDIIGKIIMNSKIMISSRLDLDVRAKVADMKKLAENSTLNLLVNQMAQYKTDKENDFAFTLRGFITKPQISRAPKERVAGRSNISADEAKEKRAERVRSRTSRRKPLPGVENDGKQQPFIPRNNERQVVQPVRGSESETQKEEVVERPEKIENIQRPDRSERPERPERQAKPEPMEREPLDTGLPVEDVPVQEDTPAKSKHNTVSEAENESSQQAEENDAASESNDSDEL